MMVFRRETCGYKRTHILRCGAGVGGKDVQRGGSGRYLKEKGGGDYCSSLQVVGEFGRGQEEMGARGQFGNAFDGLGVGEYWGDGGYALEECPQA